MLSVWGFVEKTLAWTVPTKLEKLFEYFYE